VWYLIKGTKRVKNRVRKSLQSYEGPFFVLGHLDDLVYCIQKGPNTKVKVVHHDPLKPYPCCNPLDNAWAMEQARRWTPMEVSPPALDDIDPANSILSLSQLFSNADAEEASSCTSSDPAVDIPTAAAPLLFTSPLQDSAAPGDSDSDRDSGGGVAEQCHQSHLSRKPSSQQGGPLFFSLRKAFLCRYRQIDPTLK